MRWLAVAAIWTVCTAVAVWVALEKPIGSVIFGLPGHYHGIHAGDIAAFVVAWSWSTVATIAIGPERPRRRSFD